MRTEYSLFIRSLEDAGILDTLDEMGTGLFHAKEICAK